MRQPVLVDFWAPWCGPCKQLAPILEKAVAASQGKVKLVKMNIDEHPQIAGQLGVQSIPAVIAFQKGQPVDGFVGALPESQIKQFLERLAGPMGDPIKDLLEEAAAALAAGDAETAASIYAEILDADEGQRGCARGPRHSSSSMPATSRRPRPSFSWQPGAPRRIPQSRRCGPPSRTPSRAPMSATSRISSARFEADPEDRQSRFDLALAFNAKNLREDAARELLEIIRQDRTWNEDGARLQLLKFFEEWGPMDPASVSGRRKLSGLLFR